MDFLFTALVFESRPLSEEMIKKTHEIFMEGHGDEEGGGIWAGTYGEDAVRAPYRNGKAMPFIHHSAISSHMQWLCDEYNQDVALAEMTGIIDPVTLAARYSTLFVKIHPFFDENGRLYRLLLNAILLKYMGIVMTLGERGEQDMMSISRVPSRVRTGFMQKMERWRGEGRLGGWSLRFRFCRDFKLVGEISEKLWRCDCVS